MSRLSKLLDSLQSSQLAQHLQVNNAEHNNLADITSDDIYGTLTNNTTDITSDDIDLTSTGNTYNTASLDFINKLDKPTHSSNRYSQSSQATQLGKTDFQTDDNIDNNINDNTNNHLQITNTNVKPLAKITLPKTNGFRTSLSDWSKSNGLHGLQSNINRQLDTSWADLSSMQPSQSNSSNTLSQTNSQSNNTINNQTSKQTSKPNTSKGNQTIYTGHQSEYQSLEYNTYNTSGNNMNLYNSSNIIGMNLGMNSGTNISQTFLIPEEVVDREYNIVEQMLQQEAYTLKDTVLSLGFDYLANQTKPTTNILTFNNLSDKQNNEINSMEQKIDSQTLYHNYNIKDLITVKADSNTSQANRRKIRPVLRR